MDNTAPRHVDRRDQGLRRQRLVTQAAAVGAAVLSLAFGWVFAQGSGAAAKEKSPVEPAAVESTGVPTDTPKASPSEEEDEPDVAVAEPDDEDGEDQGGAELAPPPAAPAPAPQQESDATTGGS
ncbi:hypothetical protein [Catenuloplanes indicus]|uniref:Uncharacterized protein n=1 Tax=Catenuloplanes indicus TaxID=137267 RepID=A0AAE3W4J2_9ACTN|nr:hypothetical protein [Catenuloplanes indicus]MDQ0368767.1 hypothetical protein [Catenuloplanes indicus]